MILFSSMILALALAGPIERAAPCIRPSRAGTQVQGDLQSDERRL
jgi:hypothetical protein